jgi:hypothetical protein
MVLERNIGAKQSTLSCLQKKKNYPTTRHWGAWGGRGGILLLIHDLGIRWGEWSASRPDRAIPLGKDARYPLDRRLGGPKSLSGHRL